MREMEVESNQREEIVITSKIMAVEEEEEEDKDAWPPGFRFHPTDAELVGFYLKRKIEKKPIKIDLIKHVDVYKFEPWDLPKEAGGNGEREWYFFCRRGRKYKNSVRPNRVTGAGFWKATGIDKPVYNSAGNSPHCIGLKKSLVYYRGSAGKGTKTDWMMHEFRLPVAKNATNQEAEVWTLCRIFRREPSYKKYETEWRKLSSSMRQCSSDSCSKTSLSWSDDRCDQNLEFSNGLVERKPVNAQFYGSNQLSLATQQYHQVPLMTSCLSYQIPSQIDVNWDELRPLVDFALDSSILHSFES